MITLTDPRIKPPVSQLSDSQQTQYDTLVNKALFSLGCWAYPLEEAAIRWRCYNIVITSTVVDYSEGPKVAADVRKIYTEILSRMAQGGPSTTPSTALVVS